MNKRRKLTKAQESLKQRVLNAYIKRGGFRYVPSEWDKNLWKKDTTDIYYYIDRKFRTTLDVVEYYSAMIFLYKHVPNQELLVEFHRSKQWLKVAKTYERIDKKKTLVSTEQESTHINNNEGDGIEMPHTVEFDGVI